MKPSATHKAILYGRVSTDEQAAHGYSLRHQKEQLHRFCEIKKIEVVGYFEDDASAKSFNRPEFKKLLQFLRANRRSVDMLLVVKWDRFSRNTGDSYAMIRELEGLGVTVEAVEQPLDLGIPENKLMLAFYLAQPEVENDRRSLNTRGGMRRAQHEGRWVSGAPLGYSIIPGEHGKGALVPNEDAELIRRAFYQVSSTTTPIEIIRKRMWKDGLRCSKSQFFRLLRQPAYIGKISIAAWGKEEAEIVPGQHEAIVPEALFYEVQNILDKNVKRRSKNIRLASRFPLRGTLICCKCGKPLTASTSKGNGGSYSYYHCHRLCGERYGLKKVEEALLNYIDEFQINPEVRMLYSQILTDVHQSQSKQRRHNVARLEKQIEDYEERLTKATAKYVEDTLDRAAYERLRALHEGRLVELRSELAMVKESRSVLLEQFNKGMNLLTNLTSRYLQASLDQKERILGSLFPGKLVFDGQSFRTNRLNDVLSLISNNFSDLQTQDSDQPSESAKVSHVVTPTGFEPVQPP